MSEIVIPGEKISDGSRAGYGAFTRNGHVYANVYGLLNMRNGIASVVPLHGRYIPRQGDFVIGIVDAARYRSAFIDINSAYNGRVTFFEDEQLQVGELLMLKIDYVNEINKVDLVDPRKLYDGKLVEIAAVKIPRVVGKNGSMLNVLRRGTHCTIFVGRNGRIFIKGTNENIEKAEQAIKMIEEQAHTSGLTEKISSFLGTTPDERPEKGSKKEAALHKLRKFDDALNIFNDKTENETE